MKGGERIMTKAVPIVAAFALVTGFSLAPAFGSTEIKVEGNGSGSDNSIDFDYSSDTVISQSNDTRISNDVRVTNHTGYNNVEGSTGGNVSVQSGDATADVSIENRGGVNIADVAGCGCESDYDLSIKGNGSRSDNEIDFSVDKSFVTLQDNDTDIENNVEVENVTGHNDAEGNTGGSYQKNWYPQYYFYNWLMKHHPKDYDKFHDFLKDYYNNHSGNEDGDFSLETGDAEAHVELKNTGGVNELSNN